MRANLILFRKAISPTASEIEKRPAGSKNYKGLLQYEMAERLKITRQHYNRLESGINEPSMQLLDRFYIEFPDVEDKWAIWERI